MTNPTISIIGTGNMGSSLISGLLKNGYSPDRLWAADPHDDKLEHWNKSFGIHTTSDNKQAARAADVIILAVKPQHIMAVATQIAGSVQQRSSLVLSIATGIREPSLKHWLGSGTAIVRAMPNTPAMIGCGATAMYANPQVTADQRSLAESILRAVGIVVWLDEEDLLDTVTALSGSGPAYFFLIMEALQEAAEVLGLPKDTARLLTLETALGAARMAIESDMPLTALRRHVTSPGGTTEKAISVLEDHHIRATFKMAVAAAKCRAEELANDNLGEKK